MTGKDIILDLIEQLGNDIYAVGRADEAKIAQIETLLGCNLPESYKWFLEEMGHGLIPGFEIIGNGLADTPACVSSTCNWRKYGLPLTFVVIEDSSTDWIYCLDTSKMIGGECPVVDWEQGWGVGQEYYANFLVFLEKRLQDSLTLR